MDQEDSPTDGASDAHLSSENRPRAAKATQNKSGSTATTAKKLPGTKSTVKRPTVATAPSFSKPTTSSASRTTPMSNTAKAMPRPGTRTGTRGPAGGTPGTPVVKSAHPAQPSTSSTDDIESSSMVAPSKTVSKIVAAPIRSPATKRPLSATSKQLKPASKINNPTRSAIDRAGAPSPTKSAQKPSKDPRASTDQVKSTDKPALELDASSPDPAEIAIPSTPKPSRMSIPLTTTKQRSSTAAASPAPSPHTPMRPNTAPSASASESDQWEQRTKEMEVVNEMLKEATARETLQDQINDLTRVNDALRKKLKDAQGNHSTTSEYSTGTAKDEQVATLTTKLDAHEQKISTLHEELAKSQATLSNLRQQSDIDLAKSKGALEQIKADHTSILERLSADHHHELAGLRTKMEAMDIKQKDYSQNVERQLEEARRSAGERKLQAERTLAEERALHRIELDDLNERLSAEQKAHAVANASKSTLQSEIAKLRIKLDEAKEARAEAIAHQGDLVTQKDLEIAGMRKAVSDLQHEVQNLHESRQSELDAKMNDLGKQHEKIITNLRATHEKALSSMSEERLASLVNDSNMAEEVKASLQKEIETLKKDNKSVEASLHHQLAELKATNHKLQGELDQERTAQEMSLQDAKIDLEELERALERMRRDATDQAAKNDTLQEVVEQSRKTIETLKASQAAARDEIHRLTTSADADVEKIEALESQLRQKDAIFRKDGKTAEQWNQAYSAIKEELADTLSELQEKTVALQEARKALQENEVKRSDLGEQIVGYTGQLELVQSQIAEKEEQIKILGTELLASQEDVKSAKAELDVMRLSGENKEDSLRSASPSKKQIRQLRKSRSKLLEKETSGQDTGKEDQSSLNESLKLEVQKSQENIKSMEAKNRSLEEQLRKSQNVANAKATKLNEIEALLKVTAAELTELKTNRPLRTVSGTAARSSSPKPPAAPRTPTRKVTPLRKSGWALGDENSRDDESGSSLQGTVSFPFSSPSWTPFR
ncbi:MAG: hypothetical protein M1835_004951 [Candelina submexicana]|nr:MAG: hypothetical protein M1835_004951 [Candelina submexicana]